MSRIPAFFVCSKQVQRSKQIRRQHLHFGLRHFLAKPAKELLTEELEANVMQMRRNQHQSNKKQLLTSCTNEKARHPYFSCLQLNTLAMLERRGGPPNIHRRRSSTRWGDSFSLGAGSSPTRRRRYSTRFAAAFSCAWPFVLNQLDGARLAVGKSRVIQVVGSLGSALNIIDHETSANRKSTAAC